MTINNRADPPPPPPPLHTTHPTSTSPSLPCIFHYLESDAGPLNEAEALISGGPGAAAAAAAAGLLTEAECLRRDVVGVVALTGSGDLLAAATTGSSEGSGEVGDGEGPSARTDARGGRDRRARCSST